MTPYLYFLTSTLSTQILKHANSRVMQEKSPVIKLWDANQNSESSLDTGVKEELTLICWSAAGPQLAIGTAKGEVSPMRASQQLRDHADPRASRACVWGRA